MSDPVTNAEVEDVLSSIRRLVSEDKRPLQAPGSAAASPQQAPVDPAPTGPKTAPADAADPGTNSPKDPAPDVTSGDFSAHVPKARAADAASTSAAAVPPMPRMTRRPAVEETPAEPAERPFFSARKSMTARQDAAPQAETPGTAADRLVLTPALRVASSDGKGRVPPVAELDDPVADTGASPTISPFDYDMLHDDPADLHADDYRRAAPTTEPREAADPLDQTDVRPDDAPFIHVDTAPVENDRTERLHRSGKLSDKIAALETAIGNISEEWEPDSPGDGEYSGTEPPAMAWEDEIEPDAAETTVSEPAPAPEQPKTRATGTPGIAEQVRRFADSGPRAAEPAKPAPETAEPSPGLAGDDQFLDEEALRDLVTEIVRAELQGSLGERITRNVRKLVRREIHRAMTAQDLE